MKSVFRRSVLSLLALVAIALCPLGAAAQQRTEGAGGGQQAGLLRRIRDAGSKLELTPEQKAKFDDFMAAKEKELEPLIQKAGQGDADARKSIATAMHDLRAPLAEIIGQDQFATLQKSVSGGNRANAPPRQGAPTTRPALAAGKEAAPASKVDLKTLIPMPELGTQLYKGFEGGYYPGGANQRPASHTAAGLALASQIQPLDADGKPSASGKFVLLVCGMSNTTMEAQVFIKLSNADSQKNPTLVVIDGAISGQTAFKIQNPNDNGTGAKYWATGDQRLKAAGVTRNQVQVVWLKEADAHPTSGFPKHAQDLQREEENLVRLFHDRFPNCKLAYVSNRTFGGYATSDLNPEPYAYETGFAVKWMIEKQIKGDPDLNFDPARGPVKAPWINWGPDLWANGMTPRKSDGFTYSIDDVVPKDRTHPSDSGRKKVAELLLKFLKTDPTATPWFVGKE